MQDESAAPIPVPVQIRIPRLYRVEVLDTPANWYQIKSKSRKTKLIMCSDSNLEFTCPQGPRRVIDEASREITCRRGLGGRFWSVVDWGDAPCTPHIM